MAKGRSLTASEQRATEVIRRLQELRAVPSRTWDYVEPGRVQSRKNTVAAEGLRSSDSGDTPTRRLRVIRNPDDVMLIQASEWTFRWTHWPKSSVTIRLEKLLNTVDWELDGRRVSKITEFRGDWEIVGIELVGAECWSRNGRKERTCLQLTGLASVEAFLRLADGADERDKAMGTFS